MIRRQLVPYADWATERLTPDPGAELHPDTVRGDYLMWASDRMARPEPRSKQRATVKLAGGRCAGTGPDLRYLGVRLVGPIPDSGYRARTRGTPTASTPPEPGDPMPLLLALHATGLVTDERALDQAWLRLTGEPAALCRICGQLSRRPMHAGCQRAQRGSGR